MLGYTLIAGGGSEGNPLTLQGDATEALALLRLYRALTNLLIRICACRAVQWFVAVSGIDANGPVNGRGMAAREIVATLWVVPLYIW